MTTKEDYRQRVNKVTTYIRAHLDEPISMNQLAEISAFSLFHFHRIMSALLGEPVGAFILRTRLEVAASLLRYSDLPVSEIAWKVGYDSPSSLSKSFRKFFGVSPSEYKQSKTYILMDNKQEAPAIQLSKPKIKELEAKQAIYLTVKGQYNSLDYGGVYARLWQEVKEQKLFSAGIEHLAIYYCDPDITSPENIVSDICLVVNKPAQPHDEIGVKEIPGGKYAVFTYTGPYCNLNAAYSKIFGEWLPESGYEVDHTFNFEKYVSDPCRVVPEKLKTEIYISIK